MALSIRRSKLVLHAVERKRAGFDSYTDQNYDYRKSWVEHRILLLSNAFAVSVLSYAVMSNNLHLVIANQPAAVTA